MWGVVLRTWQAGAMCEPVRQPIYLNAPRRTQLRNQTTAVVLSIVVPRLVSSPAPCRSVWQLRRDLFSSLPPDPDPPVHAGLHHLLLRNHCGLATSWSSDLGLSAHGGGETPCRAAAERFWGAHTHDDGGGPSRCWMNWPRCQLSVS